MEDIINKRFAGNRTISRSDLKQWIEGIGRKELVLINLNLLLADLRREIKIFDVDGMHDLLMEVSIKFKDAGLEKKKG